MESQASGRQGGRLAPHRGGAVLTLGIIGLVICPICSIIAVAMGSGDLRAMREGRMDPSGHGSTKGGVICAIISLSLVALWIVLWIAGAVTFTTYMSK